MKRKILLAAYLLGVLVCAAGISRSNGFIPFTHEEHLISVQLEHFFADQVGWKIELIPSRMIGIFMFLLGGSFSLAVRATLEAESYKVSVVSQKICAPN